MPSRKLKFLATRNSLLRRGIVMNLLHGTLHATILEADLLLHRDGATGGVYEKTAGTQTPSKRRLFSSIKKVLLCHHQVLEDIEESVGLTRFYATIDLEKARVGRTKLIYKEKVHPQWNESFRIYCAHVASSVIFTVKNNNPIGTILIGRAYLAVEKILNGNELDTWLDILDENRDPVNGGAKIHVKLQFFNVTRDLDWCCGIRTPSFIGVPNTFFRQREGCRVTLYQDAHVPDNCIPKIPLSGGKYYEAHRCWEDVFDAISKAKHLIYITGWSVYTEIKLVRDARRQNLNEVVTLGNLLKKKASEGVKVHMLVWDDRTSVSALRRDGLMATHDEDTANYFKYTDVRCISCPRNPDDGRSIVQGLEISTMFTHHQKTVVVDGDPIEGSQQRRIVSFVGGIDLCNGRYDSPFHPLFRTLDTTHYGDFHQPNFTDASSSKGGPREPWHDIHCKLEGPIAWDVLYNFEQRWLKQVDKYSLVNVRDLPDIIIPTSPVIVTEDPDTWNVQLFRSIDGGAVFGFPNTPEEVAIAGLITGKDNIIERSIQDAYINAIRRAKSFIYIENQYFLGSSYSWKPSDDIKVEDVGALHLIPKELSLKIVSKIQAGERFAVYVVLPMWPEGIPESQSVQAILDWQKRTMEMMYTDITRALNDVGHQANPKDYLAFFCLGNREVKLSTESIPLQKPDPNSDYGRAQQARRFMIYVHSKMMIVDDEYIIIGSANINQRSMDGGRDSEIAMGAYQPHHLADSQLPRGQIHGFRMALWYEHLEKRDDSFLHPESLECIRKVNMIADNHWVMYSSEEIYELPGHLLSYPIIVTDNGITKIPGMTSFPDTKADILGTKSEYLPPILTT